MDEPVPGAVCLTALLGSSNSHVYCSAAIDAVSVGSLLKRDDVLEKTRVFGSGGGVRSGR